MEVLTETACAHCGVLVSISDAETVCVMLTAHTAFVYHPWCWEEAAKRVIFLLHRADLEDEMEAVMGGGSSTSDVVDVVVTDDVDDRSDTEDITQSD